MYYQPENQRTEHINWTSRRTYNIDRAQPTLTELKAASSPPSGYQLPELFITDHSSENQTASRHNPVVDLTDVLLAQELLSDLIPTSQYC